MLRPSIASRSTLAAIALAVSAVVTFACLPSFAAPARESLPRVVKAQGGTWSFTTVTDANALVQCLLGSDVQVRNATLSAPPDAAGTFSNGAAIVGFDGGVVLSTGTIEGALGPNSDFGDQGTDHDAPGDPSLDLLLDPEMTYDACVLEFEFYTEEPREIEFDFVFASEEYSEFVGEGFDDVVAFFLNGSAAAHNIARVEGACASAPGLPVSVDNVNCGNVDDPGVVPVNCGCYRDNEVDLSTFPPPPTPLDSEMDGFTEVFKARGTSIAGWNTLRIAIADAGDGILDSNVYIRCASFVVPVQPSTWGGVKTRYR
jgi:hypothetical protein